MRSARAVQRMGAMSGVVFILLYFFATALLLGPISQSDSLKTAGKTFNEQADNIDVGAALIVLSIPFLMCFAATLYTQLAGAEGGGGRISALTLAGATGGGALLLAGAAMMGGISFLAESATVSGATAAASHSVGEALIFYSLTFFGIVALAGSSITMRRGVFPRWFGWLAAALGFGMILGSAASPVVRPLAFVAGMSMVLFFLVASFVVWRRVGKIVPDSSPVFT